MFLTWSLASRPRKQIVVILFAAAAADRQCVFDVSSHWLSSLCY